MAARSRHVTSATAAGLLTAVALLAALKQLPSSLRAEQAQVETNAGLSPLERELAPAHAFDVHESLALRAEQLLPRDAVFYVATGGGPGSVAAPPFYAYWLLPRRHTDDAGSAGWILSFGADPAKLPVKVDVVANLGGGAQVLRVRR
jgi:hypothetical protein